jgi:hypothetical protein
MSQGTGSTLLRAAPRPQRTHPGGDSARSRRPATRLVALPRSGWASVPRVVWSAHRSSGCPTAVLSGRPRGIGRRAAPEPLARGTHAARGAHAARMRRARGTHAVCGIACQRLCARCGGSGQLPLHEGAQAQAEPRLDLPSAGTGRARSCGGAWRHTRRTAARCARQTLHSGGSMQHATTAGRRRPAPGRRARAAATVAADGRLVTVPVGLARAHLRCTGRAR